MAVDLGSVDEKIISSEAFGKRVLSEVGVAQGKEVIVCTHTARDCRCGDIGGDLVTSLRQSDAEVKVTECSHVGGHK